ncbi:hypothetical protein L5515_019681 [Caenorhabditis briggsae]|uniref:Uncharacterized protein n=1 Tax=Caenorhabditis briggsae TaxID=6238 RepID=A0AAE9JUD8_CAEBR|nr:hypothetical protein L5515_019681 [Caenorhabditis briggsae]
MATLMGRKYRLNKNNTANANLNLVLVGLGMDLSRLPTLSTKCKAMFIVDGVKEETLEELFKSDEEAINERQQKRMRVIKEKMTENLVEDEQALEEKQKRRIRTIEAKRLKKKKKRERRKLAMILKR